MSGLPFLSPGDLPNPGIEPGSPALQADALPSEPPGKTNIYIHKHTHTHKYTYTLQLNFLQKCVDNDAPDGPFVFLCTLQSLPDHSVTYLQQFPPINIM